jgi:DNA-binding beta-propeller fold protein YncE
MIPVAARLGLVSSNLSAGLGRLWNLLCIELLLKPTSQERVRAKKKLLILGEIVGFALLAGCNGGSTQPLESTNRVSTNPVPTIITVSPASKFAGDPTSPIQLTGTNFVSSSVVNFGGSAVATNFISSTTLTAVIPAAAIATSGTATVVVSTPGPGGGISNSISFTINSVANAVPTISYLYPSCTPVGGSFTLSVSGSNLVNGSVLRWNGSDRPTTASNDVLLTAQILASDVAASGTATVTVFNPAAGVGSNSLPFTVTNGGQSPLSVAVDPTGKFAYVATDDCSGSAFGNVSMYTIDATTGALASLAPPVPSNDSGARSVTVDPSSRFAYVTNWGDGDVAGSMSMYTINSATGALTSTGSVEAPCAPPPSPGSCAPWSLALHPSGKFAYVANEGGFSPTSVSIYGVDLATGKLALVATVAADGRAVAVVVDPSGKFAYVADGGNNSDGSIGTNVSMYTIDAATGILTSIGKVAAGLSPSSIAVHPMGKFVYVANYDSNDISIYSLNTTTVNLTSIGMLAASAGSIAIHPSGKFAYVATALGVSLYTIDTTTGALTFAGTTGAGSSPGSLVIHPSGKFAYGTLAGLNSVSMYSVDATTGALTLLGTIGT